MDAKKDKNKKGEEKPNRIIRGAVLALVIVNLFVWLAVWGNSQRRYLEVYFFDVGQGDAAFVQAANGVQILVDGGPNDAVLEKLGQAMPFYDRDIDWVVLSHPERDHVAGLLAVLKNYNIHNIIWSGVPKDTAESNTWLDAVGKEGANVVVAAAGEKFNLGGQPDLTLEVLAPVDTAARSSQSANELSVMVKLTYGARSFLFTGDATSREETTAINFEPSQTDILKVAHHGSKTSADEIFMSGLLPAAAVISVGINNSYGHPNQETLDLLAKYDINTLRTDQNGDIIFRTDGERIFLRTEK